MSETTTTTTTNDERAQALASHLDIMTDEIRSDGGNYYTVNPRPVKYGTSPAEYVHNVADFKSILTPRETEELGQAIRTIEAGGSIDHDAVYKKIAGRIRNRIDKTAANRGQFVTGIYRAQHLEAIERMKKSALYVENILFWLIETNKDGNNTAGESYRAAWNGKTPEDLRTESEATDGEYIVLTEEEADKEADERAQSYIDDCVISELPEGNARDYFDGEKMKADILEDGRGSLIATYDGTEHEAARDGHIVFYIYRTN